MSATRALISSASECAPGVFFGHQTWSFFFSKGISNLSFPPCSTKEIFGTPQKCPTEWEWWQLLQIHCQGGGMIIYKDEWTQRLVMKLRITHIIGDVSFSFFLVVVFAGTGFMAKNGWNIMRLCEVWRGCEASAKPGQSQVPAACVWSLQGFAHQPEVFWVLQCFDIDGSIGFLFSPAVNMAPMDRKESLHSDLANLKAQSLRFGWKNVTFW